MFWVNFVAGLLALLVARSPRMPPVTMSSRASGLQATRQVGGTESGCKKSHWHFFYLQYTCAVQEQYVF
jgi:hypothetical protein